jgi:phosphatidylinositol-3-phosphatase
MRHRQRPSARLRPLGVVWIVPVLGLLAVGYGSTGTAAATGTLAATTSPTAAAAPGANTAGTPQTGQGITKILVIMEENHSIGQAFPTHMPYLWGLARQYGRATSWSDVGHPSLPNYLAIFGGSAFNEPQDCLPGPGCTYPGPSVFGQAIAKGASARAYEESMPKTCDLGESGNYDVNHNPWAYFPAESSLCRTNDVPAGTVTRGALTSDVAQGTLPNVGLVTPNLIHDAHDGTLAQADAWLRSWVPVLFSGADWRAGRLAIVVVFDEGETTEQVPFVIMAPGVSHKVIGRALNQYALTRLMDEIVGVPPLRKAAGAPDLVPTLGLQG